MSLIFGVSLCDRVYLVADTRVSYFKPGYAQPIVAGDNINKIEVLDDDGIIVAVAGSVGLSKYLINKLKKEDIVKHGINNLRENILDWIRINIDQYLKKRPHASACLLFGGIDRTKRKKINGKRFIELVGEFQNLSDVRLNMKEALWNGISATENNPNPNPELPTPDSRVFAVLIDTKKPSLEIEDSEWGDFLVYGPNGFRKEKLSKKFFGQLEFEIGCGELNHDRFVLTQLMKNTERDNGFQTVGGATVYYFVDEKIGSGLITGHVFEGVVGSSEITLLTDTDVINGKLHCKDATGQYVPLIPFFEYLTNDGEYSI